MRVAHPSERRLFADWAAGEGWNPGAADLDCFWAQDPDGFFLGLRHGEPMACISVVNYGTAFAFLGFYIVRPEARGRGLGLATWTAALAHAGTRVVGLDGVVAQQANYAKSGFGLAHRNLRYGGTTSAPGRLDPALVALDPVCDPRLAAALVTYDASCFPADRPAFLAAWLTAPGHVGRAVVRDGTLCGFGVARRCRDGVKLGPLLADTRRDAEALVDGLLAGVGAAALGGPVFLDVCAPHTEAVALAEGRGLAPCFETARMYTGPIRPLRAERIFGITSFELG
ncbi:MAG: GNAT family N-acetyltransferase [Alphaproteobacteria bacterium]|nr:GNAT family N-acetyltransferase [Alphaproteobacteria bacterium]